MCFLHVETVRSQVVDVAEPSQCLGARFVVRHARGDEARDAGFDVKCDFVVELPREPVRAWTEVERRGGYRWDDASLYVASRIRPTALA